MTISKRFVVSILTVTFFMLFTNVAAVAKESKKSKSHDGPQIRASATIGYTDYYLEWYNTEYSDGYPFLGLAVSGKLEKKIGFTTKFDVSITNLDMFSEDYFARMDGNRQNISGAITYAFSDNWVAYLGYRLSLADYDRFFYPSSIPDLGSKLENSIETTFIDHETHGPLIGVGYSAKRGKNNTYGIILGTAYLKSELTMAAPSPDRRSWEVTESAFGATVAAFWTHNIESSLSYTLQVNGDFFDYGGEIQLLERIISLSLNLNYRF